LHWFLTSHVSLNAVHERCTQPGEEVVSPVRTFCGHERKGINVSAILCGCL